MFYLKLAINNLKQSFQHFAPFFLVSITTFIFTSITLLILASPTVKSMGTGVVALELAIVVLVILSAILCLYSFNFLLRQRNQEFGLYNILGMNKKQIIWLSTLELGIVYFLTVVLGSILSAIFSKLFYLIFVHLINYDQLHFSVSPVAFVISISVFAGIFLFLEVVNVIKISRTTALNLFGNQSQGEREPRGNIFLALIGVSALAFGYYLSLTAGEVSALVGITRFFQAILAVILGTYLFFISFISWYLKARRKNKGHFYKPENFITVSQMIFRMKQNAAGLANITLLAIMAFVTIFSTVALYTSTENLVKMSFPKTDKVEIQSINNRQEAESIMENQIYTPLKNAGVDAHDQFSTYMNLSFTILYNQEDNLIVDERATNGYQDLASINQAGIMEVMSQEDFRKLGNDLPQLEKGQVAFASYDASKSIEPFKTLTWFGQSYENVYQIKSLKNMLLMNSAIPAGVLVVSDDATMESMRVPYDQVSRFDYNYNYIAFADLSKEERLVLQDTSENRNNHLPYYEEDGTVALYESQDNYRKESLQMTGGFLFTGFLLGIAFLLGAALIIYYKQISEGSQDKRSYRILQEVGMSFNQVKKTINSQIILVFFLPLGIAIIHFLMALPILKKLLLFFGVQGDQFIYSVSAVTVLGILLIYFLIYKLTSRSYYKMIER